MDESTLQDYYAARAPEYDRIYLKPERQPDLRAIEKWLPDVFKDRRVLEVACGTGYWTQFLAPGARELVAVDASSEVLRIASARVAASNVRFVQGDAYRLPADATAYDGAFAGFWISHVPHARIAEFFRGLHDKLAPGAKVVLLDNRYVAGSSTPVSEVDADGDTYQSRPLDDGSVHRVLKNFPSPDEVRAWLHGAASDIRFHQWPYYWAVEYTLV
jgi:SAM-dependent methyltransferase